jgi:hypothetical protein
MPSVLGIDIGYGFTKSFYFQRSIKSKSMFLFDLFPTAVSKFIPKATFSDMDTTVQVNNEVFIVGEPAIREGVGIINTRQSGFVGSNAYCAVLSLALERTIRNPDILILGIPPGQYNKEYVNGLIAKIMSSKITLSSKKDITIGHIIKFIPQGSGIFFSHVCNGGDDALNKSIAIVDVGFYTLDTLFFVNGKYVENSARSFQLGVSRLYEQVEKEFQNQYRIRLKNNKTIDQILKTGKVRIMDKTYEFDAGHILESYNIQVSTNLASYIENLPDEVDTLIGGGGGVCFIDNCAFKYKMTITEHPQFANARGYFEHGKHIMARN